MSSITPTGQDDLTLQIGYGIKLSLDNTTDDQKY